MATRIQVRRGTNTQWNNADPILNEGEFGYSTTDSQFKIGDGETIWSELTYVPSESSLGSSLGDYIELAEKGAIDGVAELDGSRNILAPAGIIFEGTANDHETTLSVTDPTADRTITFPDVTGTVITTGNLSDITNIGVFTSTIVMEGSTANDHELTISAGDPTADRTATFPDATGTIVLHDATQTLTNKTIAFANNTVSGTLAEFNTAVTDADLVSIAGTETLTNKTLTSPKINEDVAVTATATELNLIDGSIAGTVVNSKAVIYGAAGEVNATTLQIAGTSITASATELNYVDGVTSSIQTQLDARVEESLFDAKGDLLVGSADNTPAKLTVGTDGYILTANTSAANGIEWAAAPVGYSPPTLGSTQIASGATVTTISGLTLSSPIVSGLALSDSSIVFEGATANDFETTLTVTDPTEDRTITFPNATGTVALAENVAALSGATFTGAISGTSLTLSGDLTINGTTTTINSTTLTVDDKNIVLGDVETPTDTTADGGGITLKGATDKTFNWVDATDAWTSSEHMNLLTGKSYKINNTAISAALPALTWGEVKNGKSGLVIS
jgi:cytoskeletal protein CcmA (bactofilin family)